MTTDQMPHVTRRRFLAGAAGLSAAGLLAACSSSNSPAQTSSTTAASTTGPGATSPTGTTSATGAAGSSSTATASGLPAYVRYAGVQADIPAPNEYCVDGFLGFPENPVQAVAGTPGSGGSVKFAVYAYGGGPSSMGSNKWWQALNTRLGLTVDLQVIPVADYWTKLATMIAGGDLPDVTHVSFNYLAGSVDAVEAIFTDLTEYVGGDAVKDYPMLANLPTAAWQSAQVNGKILGVPQVELPLGNQYVARADIFDSLKVSGDVADSTEFTALCKALTNEKANRWAVGQAGGLSNYINVMFGVPNNWKVDGGKFTKDIETAEYTDALSYTAGLWKAGYFYPDTFANSTVLASTLFASGKIAMMYGGGSGVVGSDFASLYATTSGLRISFLSPPKAGGGGLAAAYLSSQNNGFAAISKKASPDKIKQILGVLNILAAPFGTAEYALTNYGVKGVDYTYDTSTKNITTTAQYKSENPGLYNYPGSPNVFFAPGYDYVTKAGCAWQAQESQNVAQWPTLGLVSPTDLKEGNKLAGAVATAVNGIVQGHQPVSSWKDVVKTWQSGGGNTIRSEYEAAYAKAHS